MNRDKTEIWRGGLAGVLGGSSAQPLPHPGAESTEPVRGAAPAAAPASAPAVPASGGESPPARALPPPTARTIIARYGIASLQSAHPRGVPASTRILPVEALVPPERRAAPKVASVASAASTEGDRITDRESERALASLRGGQGRLLRRGAMAGLGLILLLFLRLPAPQANEPRATPAPARQSNGASVVRPAGAPAHAAAPAREVAAPHASTSGAMHASEPLAATATARRGARQARGRQRAAVDALASGDHASAIRLYGELARDRPDVPAYAYAAAILRERQAGRSR